MCPSVYMHFSQDLSTPKVQYRSLPKDSGKTKLPDWIENGGPPHISFISDSSNSLQNYVLKYVEYCELKEKQ